jgi:hypothetical protein
VFRTDADYTFFASDGAHHDENNKYGSVTRTFGTLDNPVGTAPPIDVIIHRTHPLRKSPAAQTVQRPAEEIASHIKSTNGVAP